MIFDKPKRLINENARPLLGLKKDKKDVRDHLSKNFTTITRHLLSEHSSFVKSQRVMNSCTAHSAMLVFEMEQRINDSWWKIEGSEQHNYYYSRIDSGIFPDDGGSYLRSACKIMHQVGVCPEKLMPYIDYKPNYHPGIFANSFSRFWKIKEYTRQIDLDSIKEAITNNHPVLLGIPVFNNWRGLIKNIIPLPSGRTIGGHAITVIGFDDSLGLFIQNSWGTNWGVNGKAWLPYEYLDNVSWFDAWSLQL